MNRTWIPGKNIGISKISEKWGFSKIPEKSATFRKNRFVVILAQNLAKLSRHTKVAWIQQNCSVRLKNRNNNNFDVFTWHDAISLIFDEKWKTRGSRRSRRLVHQTPVMNSIYLGYLLNLTRSVNTLIYLCSKLHLTRKVHSDLNISFHVFSRYLDVNCTISIRLFKAYLRLSGSIIHWVPNYLIEIWLIWYKVTRIITRPD